MTLKEKLDQIDQLVRVLQLHERVTYGTPPEVGKFAILNEPSFKGVDRDTIKERLMILLKAETSEITK
jgi:hypothetical protein